MAELVESNSCGYQGYEFGAGTYPDSICIDGRLFDADDCDDEGNLYEPLLDIPCPMCDPKAAIEYWTEQNSLSGGSKKAARKAAQSLVADIRKNRGVDDKRVPALCEGSEAALQEIIAAQGRT